MVRLLRSRDSPKPMLLADVISTESHELDSFQVILRGFL